MKDSSHDDVDDMKKGQEKPSKDDSQYLDGNKFEKDSSISPNHVRQVNGGIVYEKTQQQVPTESVPTILSPLEQILAVHEINQNVINGLHPKPSELILASEEEKLLTKAVSFIIDH